MVSKITAIIMAIVSLVSSMGSAMPSKQTLYTDVAYGTHSRQVMDVCFPEKYEENMGVVLYLHGGGWVSGDKKNFLAKAKNMSKAANCIGVTMNYRYASGNVHCVDILADIDSALAKVKLMAETRGINCTKVMLAGHSAGGHLALLYAYAKRWSAPITPGAVVSYSGPTDLTSKTFIENNSLNNADAMRTVVSALVGVKLTKENFASNKAKILNVSPIKHVSSGCVPTIVVQGRQDTIVPTVDTRLFVNALKAKGVTYRYFEMPNSGHSLNMDPLYTEASENTILEYAKKYLK